MTVRTILRKAKSNIGNSTDMVDLESMENIPLLETDYRDTAPEKTKKSHLRLTRWTNGRSRTLSSDTLLERSSCIRSFFRSFYRCCCGVRPEYKERFLELKKGKKKTYYVNNALRNTKYNILTFFPLVLIDQFRYFLNLFYLLVSLSQFVPALKVGPLFTYFAPLVFVVSLSVLSEAIDDIKRFIRDKELNNSLYRKLTPHGYITVTASKIQVGDIILIEANQRVPADGIFIRTTEKGGATFVRTDQLDGETDWKLRRAVNITQNLKNEMNLFTLDALWHIEAPRQNIYEFNGKVTSYNLNDISIPSETPASLHVSPPPPMENSTVEALTLETTLWANTTVTSGTVTALVIYTGKETRSAMNTNAASVKRGAFDIELNFLTKLLFIFLVILSFILVIFRGLTGAWIIYFARFMLLVSSIIPISLRVNLEMAKILYSLSIMKDPKIPETLVRTSNIPEELGRIEYLLTDKTGTLTKNDMIWKRLHVGRASFGPDDIPKLREFVLRYYKTFPNNESDEGENAVPSSLPSSSLSLSLSVKRLEIVSIVNNAIKGLSLCHNVSPLEQEDNISYQAASPDEVALVKFANSVGLKLIKRDERYIILQTPVGHTLKYFILQCFPFNSETKRMGIIVREETTNKILFFVKGAESVLLPAIQPRGSNWLREECDNLARQGLRTLALAYREFSDYEFKEFQKRYSAASASMFDRSSRCQEEIDRITQDLYLLGLTGVEDKLYSAIPQTLESLHHAGIKVWMLTGDKVETATCVAISAGLKSRRHALHVISSHQITSLAHAQEALQRFVSGFTEAVLVVDGSVLEMYLSSFAQFFINAAAQASSVICCRCSPTQKASIVSAIKKYTKLRTCAVGDGGNDVSMIQAADVGIGIVGKEGKQASLAADFSIPQFSYIQRLLLWHGRNSYQRSAKLAQFVIHRGLIISVMQAIFSAIFFFLPIALFQGWLLVGYSTYYTMAPVFSLVLDVELPESVVFLYPELYQKLKNGRIMSTKTFFQWVAKSVFQGGMVMLLAIALFEDSFINIIDIAFSSLVLAELLNVASEINTWHPLMIASEICTVVVYIFSMFIFRESFNVLFIMTLDFWWKVIVITSASWIPTLLLNFIQRKLQPPQYTKLSVIQ